MTYTIEVSTQNRTDFIDITSEVQGIVKKSGLKEGQCFLFVPHTTAAVTINENADPSVVEDIDKELNKVIPFNDRYSHAEGNSAAHIKASLIGPEQMVFIENSSLKLGTWQGIYFCEFDGPRSRKVWVRVDD
jgi:secondary thiamine-phosphate synthase enzyme